MGRVNPFEDGPCKHCVSPVWVTATEPGPPAFTSEPPSPAGLSLRQEQDGPEHPTCRPPPPSRTLSPGGFAAVIWGCWGGLTPFRAAGRGLGRAAGTGRDSSLPPRPGIRGHGSRPPPCPAGRASRDPTERWIPAMGVTARPASACGWIDR